ncbi:FecR family protein [Oceanospirillum linum]|uniref:FecR protein domain-containing protein n=1 Tax=Oceanospirillum linum TaxID=966 RepID=A0A1T1HAT6_OCELI|nr:FecR domain-containing protein [Oceanospirillum linum]OOV86969.1 hypothetical protein BTA35_0208065 [Oceanospirillum linum]SEF70000.1 FecR protein [Oleiphilus messinensis]SMP15177.1 FecR family protein [Oceanospirillum linum]
MQQLTARLPLTNRKQHKPFGYSLLSGLVLALGGAILSFSAYAENPAHTQNLMPSASVSKNAHSEQPVGTITLALGRAIIEKPDGERLKASTGDNLYPGDSLTTYSSGYLHLRFVDNALLSMRPESTLSIDTYNYDPNSPELSAVRFNLKEGMARSVSGSAAKHDHQKFRLNTPIAAIGVRGTDFTVLANQDTVRTFVSEGAIVVSPFSSECQTLSLGPCAKDGVELKGNSNLLVELNSVSVRPQLLQLGLETPATSNLLMNDAVIAQLSPLPLQNSSVSSATRLAASESENEDNTLVDTDLSEALPESDSSSTEEPQYLADSEQDDIDGVSNGQSQEDTLLVASQNTSVGSINTLPPNNESVSNQFNDDEIGTDIIPKAPDGITVPDGVLWSYQSPVAPQRFNAPDFIYTDTQVVAGIESGTIDKHMVFSNERFALYRPDELYDTINPIRPNPGSVGFQLQQGAAFYYAKGQQFDLNFDSGKLLIDFEKGKFSTALQMSHEETGQVSFSTSGDISANGLFSSQQPDHSLSGAVSLDTEEAGYYFEQSVPHLDSTIDGITTWQSSD